MPPKRRASRGRRPSPIKTKRSISRSRSRRRSTSKKRVSKKKKSTSRAKRRSVPKRRTRKSKSKSRRRRTSKSKSKSKSRRRSAARISGDPVALDYNTDERVGRLDDFLSFREEPGPNFELCVDRDGYMGDAVRLIKQIGSTSDNGEAWLAEIRGDRKGDQPLLFVVKKMPLRPTRGTRITPDQPFFQSGGMERFFSEAALEHESWAEVFAMHVVRLFIEQRICPNFLLLYDFNYCPRCEYSNPALVRDTSQCIMMSSELATYDYKTWQQEARRTPAQYRSAAFQLLAGLRTMEKYCGMYHRDLHHGNILVLGPKGRGETTPRGYWIYRIDGDKYYVPNYRHLFLIWDFQFAYSPGVIDPVDKRDDHRDPANIWCVAGGVADYDRAFGVDLLETSTDGKASDAVFKMMQRIQDLAADEVPLKELFDELFSDWRKEPTGSYDIIEEYNMDKPVDAPLEICRTGIFKHGTTTATCEDYTTAPVKMPPAPRGAALAKCRDRQP